MSRQSKRDLRKRLDLLTLSVQDEDEEGGEARQDIGA